MSPPISQELETERSIRHVGVGCQDGEGDERARVTNSVWVRNVRLGNLLVPQMVGSNPAGPTTPQ